MLGRLMPFWGCKAACKPGIGMRLHTEMEQMCNCICQHQCVHMHGVVLSYDTICRAMAQIGRQGYGLEQGQNSLRHAVNTSVSKSGQESSQPIRVQCWGDACAMYRQHSRPYITCHRMMFIFRPCDKQVGSKGKYKTAQANIHAQSIRYVAEHERQAETMLYAVCCTVPCYTMPCHTIPYYAVLCCAVLCHSMPCHAVLFHVMLCRAVLPSCAVSGCALPCCAVPFHAMLCCAMPCCAVQ